MPKALLFQVVFDSPKWRSIVLRSMILPQEAHLGKEAPRSSMWIQTLRVKQLGPVYMWCILEAEALVSDGHLRRARGSFLEHESWADS